MIEFDLVAIPTKSTIVKYFENSLKSVIKIKIYEDGIQLDGHEELVTKVVKAKAKISLQPSFYLQETDLYCLQKSQLAYAIVNKVQPPDFSNDNQTKKL